MWAINFSLREGSMQIVIFSKKHVVQELKVNDVLKAALRDAEAQYASLYARL